MSLPLFGASTPDLEPAAVRSRSRGSLVQHDSHGRRLTVVALALVFFAALGYLLTHLLLRYLTPSLTSLETIAYYLAGHTDRLDMQAVAHALRTHEIYLYSQLLATTEVVLAVHDAHVFTLWLTLAIVFSALLAALAILSAVQERRRLQRTGPADVVSASCMGIRLEGTFIPCPFPHPCLPRMSLDQYRHSSQASRRSDAPDLSSLDTEPVHTPLALALLELYLASPTHPAEPTLSADSRAFDASHPATTRLRHNRTPLLQHALLIRERMLTQALQHHLPRPLVELVALGHDLGKLVTLVLEHERWIRAIRHHDRMSLVLLTTLSEWHALPEADRTDLRVAIRFHHTLPDALPSSLSPRARALRDLLARAHTFTLWAESASPQTAPDLTPVPPPDAPAPVAAPPAPCIRHRSPAPATPAEQPPVLPDTPPPGLSASSSPAPAPSPSPVAPPTSADLPPLLLTPDLCARVAQALQDTLPRLAVNTHTAFDGLVIPKDGLVMVLDHALRHHLASCLTESDRALLHIDPGEPRPASAKMPVPHPSAPVIAAALRQLGWLTETHAEQVGTLWEVVVGRRKWLACWLLTQSALPSALIADWTSASPPFVPTPKHPSWRDPALPLSAPTPADAPTPAPSAHPAGRVTPGALLLLGTVALGGWLFTLSHADRTAVTCTTVSKIATWVKGAESTGTTLDTTIKQWADHAITQCPQIMDEKVAPLTTKAADALHAGSTTVQKGVGTARQVLRGRLVSIDPGDLSIDVTGIGTVRLLGLRIPPETETPAYEFLRTCCHKKRLEVETYAEKDAEGYPLVTLYRGDRAARGLLPDPADSINAQLVERELAQPWTLVLPEAPWTRPQPVRPGPAYPASLPSSS